MKIPWKIKVDLPWPMSFELITHWHFLQQCFGNFNTFGTQYLLEIR